MKNSLKILALFFMFGIVISSKIFAEPMVINFNDMIKQSKTIVMGTYLGYNGKTPYDSFKFYFKVYQTLKGETQADTIILNRAGSGAVELAIGTYCVAFINNNDAFEWVGTSNTVHKNLDNSLLFLQGFYDFNAYIVAPATISISQLKEYLKNDSYSGSVYGDVHFFSNTTKKMEASPIHIEVNYTYKDNVITNEVTINGIELNDFTKKPVFSLPFWDNIVTVEYESNGYRPLEIRGKILEDYSTANRFNAMFWLYAPEELTYDEFIDFVKTTSYGPPYFECEVKTEANKIYTLLINDEMGRIGKLLNYNGKDLPISFTSTSPKREIGFSNYPNDLRLEFDSILVSKEVFEFAGEDMIRELKFGPVQAAIYSKVGETNKVLGRCTVSYKATKFVKNK